jgi:hypothetical protein
MEMSSTSTSNSLSRNCAITSSPLPASPVTSMSGSSAMNWRRPAHDLVIVGDQDANHLCLHGEGWPGFGWTGRLFAL